MCVSLLERPRIPGGGLSCHWWPVQGCMLTDTGSKGQKRSHTHFTSRVGPHSLVTSRSSQSSLQRGPPIAAAAKGYKRKGTWLTHRTESPSQTQETFRIFPEHWNCWLCLQLSGNQFCCVSLSECSWHNFQGVWYLQNKIFLTHTASSHNEYRSWIRSGSMCFRDPTLYPALF